MGHGIAVRSLSQTQEKTMKRIAVLTFVILFWTSLSLARPIRDMWINMPDSMIPYLNKNLRIELVDFIDMKVKSEVTNLLSENTVMDSLSTTYLSVSLNKSCNLEMKVLPREGGDSLLCMITTVKGPAQESRVEFYNQDWQPLYMSKPFDGGELQDLYSSLKHRPDTMSQERYEALQDMLNPPMMHVQFAPGEDAIIVEPSLPLLNEEDKNSVKSIILQRKFKWNGKEFKKS